MAYVKGCVRTVSGSQTLARGLCALQAVADAPAGITAQQVADRIGVHRTIAYRLLATLAEFRLVAKGTDGRYRPGAGLAALGASFDRNLRQLSLPVLQGLADELGTTVSLLVAEGEQQVAVAVIVPTVVAYQLAFHEGSRHPLSRGAAGAALLSAMPPQPDERELVTRAREQGWVITHGEIEPHTFGLAVPVRRGQNTLAALNVSLHISHLRGLSVEDDLVPRLQAVAAAIADDFGGRSESGSEPTVSPQ